MAETQIRIELLSFKPFFPIYVRILAKRLKIDLKNIKIYKQFFLINLFSNGDETYHFVENLFNFGNFFNIQTVKYSYKLLTK